MRCSSSRAVLFLLFTACVSSSTRYFLPSPQNPTYSLESATPVLREYVRLQCPALRQKERADSGAIGALVEMDSSGKATRARLEGTTGDEVLDGVIGTVVAQLLMARAASAMSAAAVPSSERVRIDYRCAGDSAVVRLARQP